MEQNFTAMLTLPESHIRAAVRDYVGAGRAGADFGSCPVLWVMLEHRHGPVRGEFMAHVTVQTGGF